MSLIRWNPARDMLSHRTPFDRFFDEHFWGPGSLDFARHGTGNIALDIYEKDNNVIVQASLPGVDAKDLDVHVRDDLLTICGEVKEGKEKKDESYYMREQRRGRFERSVVLPTPVIADRAEALFENGMLTLTLPKSAEAASKKIKIQTS